MGAAIGGLPVNIGHIAAKADGGPFAGIYFAAAVGVARAYPQINIDSLLNKAGEQMKRAIAAMCIAQFVLTYAFQRIESYTKGGVNPLGNPTVKQVIADDAMGVAGPPKIPMQIYMAIFDELVVTPDVTALVNTYCAAGATIQYLQFPLADPPHRRGRRPPWRHRLHASPLRRPARPQQLLTRSHRGLETYSKPAQRT